MLRIDVADIPEGGLDVVETLVEAWFQPLLGPQFFPGKGPLTATFKLVRTGKNVLVTGRITGGLRFVCSRCAEEADHRVEHPFVHVFAEHGEGDIDLPDDFDPAASLEELEMSDFDGDHVDIEALAAEELVLSLPPFPLCSDACKGICQRCGKNLNEGPCECQADVVDPRWARLRELKL